MFSLGYLVGVTIRLLKHPSAIPMIRKGRQATARRIDEVRKTDFSRNPITLKATHGFSVALNPHDVGVCPAIADGLYEPAVTGLFNRLVKEGMTIVDVGANVGWYTLLAAKRVGKSGRVLAFEPDPVNFSLLSQSVSLNRFAQVTLLQECVAREAGVRTLYLAEGNLGGHSMVEHKDRSTIPVKAVTLDEELRRLSIHRVDVMKVDVEGADAEVLLGCTDYAPRISHLIIEYTPRAYDSYPQLKRRLLANYDMFQIVDSPFLVKRLTRAQFNHLERVTNLYLRRVDSHMAG